MIVWIDIRVSIFFFIVFVTNGQLGNVTIRLSDGIRKLKVGLLAPLNMTGGSVDAQDGNINQQIGFLRSAGAVMIALKRIADEQVLPNTNVT
uniref:Uncharacterized protein n=1 Tax=Acrobeloides nanus TaxID=290746 RepID=A0A914CKZ0_9BILA